MWMKTIDVVRSATRWVGRLLDVRLRMDIAAGIRTAERRFWRGSNLWMIPR
jgi:hypothetical protein